MRLNVVIIIIIYIILLYICKDTNWFLALVAPNPKFAHESVWFLIIDKTESWSIKVHRWQDFNRSPYIFDNLEIFIEQLSAIDTAVSSQIRVGTWKRFVGSKRLICRYPTCNYMLFHWDGKTLQVIVATKTFICEIQDVVRWIRIRKRDHEEIV